MTSPLLTDLAARVQGALRPLAAPMSYRTATTFQARTAAPAAAGATVLQLTPPAGMDRVHPGDTFSTGGPALKTVTAEVAAAGGVIAAPFSPPLAAALPAGASVPITRATSCTVQGWEETMDATRPASALVQANDTTLCILADSLPLEPAPGHQVVAGAGRVLTVRHASRDGSGAVWRILAGA